MLIFSILVLQVLPVCFCYDVELKGNLNIANKLFEREVLRRPSELVRRILSNLPSKIEGKGKLPRADTLAIPYLITSNKEKNMEKSQSQNTVESILQALPYLLRSKHSIESTRKIKNENQKPGSLDELDSRSKLEQFVEHLKRTGKETIDRITFYIKKEFNIKKNITHIVKIVTDDYTDMLQNYYDYIKKNISDYDRDLLYFDMIGTSHQLLFNEENKLLNDIIMHEDDNHHAHNGNYQKINKEFLRFSYIYKRDTMRHVCDTYNICKEYPVITEYGAEVINEVLMLNDKQFLTILQTLAKILKDNEKVIARVTKTKDRDLMQVKLKDCTTDLFATKEYFSVARAVISQRFKPVTSGSEEFKVKIRATRMFLDILEKALNVEEDWITIDFDNSIQAIRNWRDYKRDDVEGIHEEFARHLLKRLEYNLTKNARNEIKVLITAMMRESTEDLQHLLKFGSKYLKGDDFHSDIDIII